MTRREETETSVVDVINQIGIPAPSGGNNINGTLEIVAKVVNERTGDGTVPLVSQGFLNHGTNREKTHNITIDDAEHGDVFNNKEVVQEIIDRIADAV